MAKKKCATNPIQKWIKGYTKKNGQVVKSHYKTIRNSLIFDNLSSK